MTNPDDLLRQVFTRRRAKDQALIERITDHHVARTMLAGAMSRADDEPELTAAELLAAAVADNQEETNAD